MAKVRDWAWVRRWVLHHDRSSSALYRLTFPRDAEDASPLSILIGSAGLMVSTVAFGVLVYLGSLPLDKDAAGNASFFGAIAFLITAAVVGGEVAEQVGRLKRPPRAASVMRDLAARLNELGTSLDQALREVETLRERADQVEALNQRLAGENSDLIKIADAMKSPDSQQAYLRVMRKETRRSLAWTFLQGALWFLGGIVVALVLQHQGG